MKEKEPTLGLGWDSEVDAGVEAVFDTRVKKEMRQTMKKLESEGKFEGREGDIVIFDAFGRFREIVPRGEYYTQTERPFGEFEKRFGDHKAMEIRSDKE